MGEPNPRAIFGGRFVRNRDRMADFNARKTGAPSAAEREMHPSWAEDVRYDSGRYDNPPPPRGSGRPRGRGRGRSTNRGSGLPTSQKAGPNPYQSTEQSPPSDEPRYDIKAAAAMVSDMDNEFFSFTTEGFVTLVEQSHNHLKAVDSRLTRILPFPVYLHLMNELLQVHLMKLTTPSRQQQTWEEPLDIDELHNLVNGDDITIPAEIYHYLKGLGKWTDKTGVNWWPSVPAAIVPQPRRLVGNAEVEGGDFGIPDANNHNAYEISIAPVATRRLVTATLTGAAAVIVYNPLPVPLQPQNLIVNENFLGYYPTIRRPHAEALEYYAGFDNSWSVSPLASRFAHNGILWSKYVAAMHSISDKIETMSGLPPLDKGSQSNYAFVETVAPEPTIRRGKMMIYSSALLDPSVLSVAMMHTYRRRRTEDRHGCSYTGAGDLPPGGWVETRNASFEQQDPFQSVNVEPDGSLDIIRFSQGAPEDRVTLLLSQVERLFSKR